MKSAWIGAIFLALCGILRSTDLFFRIPVLEALPVLVIVMWEHMINTVAILPVGFKYRLDYRKIARLDVLLFMLVGWGASAMGILCFTQAFKFMNPALVILLQKLQPVITILLGVVFLKESLSRRFFLWAPLAIVASYFVSFSLTNPFSGEWKQIAMGTGFTLLAALFWGSGTVWGKLLLRKFDANFVLANRFLMGMVFTVVLAVTFVGGNAFSDVVSRPDLLGRLLYMALVPGLVATGFFYWGLHKVDASIASILELIFPLSSVVIMWVFFHQPLDIVQIAAAVVLFVSIIAITREHGNRH